MRNQVYVMGRFDLAPDEAFVVDVSDGGAEYFTVPLSNIWGTTLELVDRTGSLNKAQSVANEDGTYTYVISPTDPGVRELDRLRRTERRHPDAADGRVRRRRSEGGSRRARPGGQARRPRRRGADAAPGHRCRSGRPSSPIAARRICAACPKGRSDMGRWLITGCSTGIGREIARAALEAGHTVVVTARRIETVQDFVDEFGDRARGRRPRRDRQGPDRRRGGRAPTPRSAASTCWSTTPATATCRRSRRVRTPRSESCSTPTTSASSTRSRRCCPSMRARRSGHIVNISSMTGLVANPPNAYYSSTKFALEALTEALAQEVKPLGIKVTAIEPGAFRTDWAKRSMWESSTPDRRLRRERRRPQDADQGVRRSPARRPAQGRRGGADGDRRSTSRRCACCSAATC